MKKRFIIIILDGFGVGAMDDVAEVRPGDMGANTALHILQKNKTLALPNLETLGLINILGIEINGMGFSSGAAFGTSNLAHFGADTFYGHQEIMGTKPKRPVYQPFLENADSVAKELRDRNYQVKIIHGTNGGKILLVNNVLTIADNIETDSGQAYNVTSALDSVPFEDVIDIGKIVRAMVKVSRVIVFGGEGIGIDDIISAKEEKGDCFFGISAPKSGVYNKGYRCVHMGYGVDSKIQLPNILNEVNISTSLFGKVADIVGNPHGKSFPGVDTAKVLEMTLKEMGLVNKGFICTNVQETDLCGHRENVEAYSEKLEIADFYIGKIMNELEDDDMLLVMADHGNDPTIGHPRHTRERVPIMLWGRNVKPCDIGIRDTLSDVASTVSEFFDAKTSTEYGQSFLNIIKS